MKTIETGKDKVKKICDVLRRETLDPAKEEARDIIEKGKEEAKRLVEEGKKEVERLHREAKEKIEEERKLFQASIHVACKKSLGILRQDIEKNLFNPELKTLLEKPLRDPKLIAKLIEAIVLAAKRDGLDTDLHAVIPQSVSKEEVNSALVGGIIERLSKKSVELSDIKGGAKVQLKDNYLTIDMSESALQELLADYIREDFRSIVFNAI